jgi:hypothetical protein
MSMSVLRHACNRVPHAEHHDTDDELAGAMSWRVMYLSESIQGEPIAVTGKVWVPVGDPPDEGYQVVALARATNAIADECAPSKDEVPAPPWAAGVVTGSVEAGYVVAMTDYEGLGTPGRNPYLVGESEGRGVLDAAKAAAQLPDVGLSGPCRSLRHDCGRMTT